MAEEGRWQQAALAVPAAGRGPFWLGGLWERWIGADGGELETCVILTTAPNDLLARVHDRMPVVIPDGVEEAWLAPADGPALRALEPLMAPWQPVGWEAVKLETMPGAPSARDGPTRGWGRAAFSPDPWVTPLCR